jgi:hypothetical protein
MIDHTSHVTRVRHRAPAHRPPRSVATWPVPFTVHRCCLVVLAIIEWWPAPDNDCISPNSWTGPPLSHKHTQHRPRDKRYHLFHTNTQQLFTPGQQRSSSTFRSPKKCRRSRTPRPSRHSRVIGRTETLHTHVSIACSRRTTPKASQVSALGLDLAARSLCAPCPPALLCKLPDRALVYLPCYSGDCNAEKRSR